MPGLRILLGEINSEWASLVKRLAAADQGIKIVGQVKHPLDLLLQAKTLNVDVVVISQLPDGGEPGICSHLVLEVPNVTIVLVPTSAAPAMLIRMVLYRDQLPASEKALYAAIRGRLEPI
jgi:DNA-binding NarL/FixJ family response regulator